VGGYVEKDCHGCTELRVHGVSGTPPERMLCHPSVIRIAGDDVAGFYRRWWSRRPPYREDESDRDARRQEAYAWGGLTAGSKFRALWLLLLPFMLVNVAFFMVPYSPPDDEGSRRRPLRRFGEAVQRLFALSLTCALVLTAVSVSLDLVMWQCTRQPECAAGEFGRFGFLGAGILDQPSRRLALATLVPIAAVVLLAWLSRSTSQRYEDVYIEGRNGATTARKPLEQRKLWNGTGPIRRLRMVHVTASLALIGVLLAAPLARSGAWAAPLRVVLVVLLCLLGVAVVLVLIPDTARRSEPASGDKRQHESPNVVDSDDGHAGVSSVEEGKRALVYSVPMWAAIAAVVAAIVVALLPDAGPPTSAPFAGSRNLPWFSSTVRFVVLLQAACWLVILAVTCILAWSTRRPATEPLQPQPPAAGVAVETGRTWWGLGTPAILLAAWLVSGAYSAGVTLGVGDFLGDPVPLGDESNVPIPLAVPPIYFWAAVGGALTLALILGVGVLVGVRLLRTSGELYRTDVPHAYPLDHKPTSQDIRRQRSIARTWAVAQAAEIARVSAGWGLLVVALLVYAGLGLAMLPGSVERLARLPEDVVSWSVAIIVAATGALVLFGRSAIKDPRRRRTIGVLWDVGTFWPRATHPLGPPSYGERVLPELLNRVKHLTQTERDVVILSGHSQGAVICMALVLLLDDAARKRVCLLMYGSPVRRLYTRYFPGYFDDATLVHVGEILGQGEGAQPRQRETWAWRNLFRPTDPIGGPIFFRYEVQDSDTCDPDRQLLDPEFEFPASKGDVAYPATFGHSDYFVDPLYAAARRQIEELQERRSA
jgi:hypothetical protein